MPPISIQTQNPIYSLQIQHFGGDLVPTDKAKLILASSSPRRRDLLEQLDMEFEVRGSNVSEHIDGPVPPVEYVETLAVRKAQAVAASLETQAADAFVIAADTVVTADSKILGKPKNPEEAVSMLSFLQGRTHTVYTGLCVWNVREQYKLSGFSFTDVTMRPLSREQIDRYVDTGEPMDKAGSYGIQGYGSTLVTRIQGDYFTVVGLPIYLLYDYLKQFGVIMY